MVSECVNIDYVADYCNKERLSTLSEKFSSSFQGKIVEFFCRAPGRVNLIGEHVDYCGYGVLPMAVNQDIMMAVAKNDEKKIRLINTLGKYEPYETSVDCIQICQNQPKWFHYFLCGFRGVMERMKERNGNKKAEGIHIEGTTPQRDHSKGENVEVGLGVGAWGMDVLVDGCVPSCAGLSSSSALVCAAALATMVLYQGEAAYTKLELAELCQHCEKYIGTEGGGMDQSIAFLAQQGKAKYVEFNPLRVTDVPLPRGVAFVIANSCVELNKAATCHFNTRVAECRLAAQVLASKEGIDWKVVRKLVDVQNVLKLSLAECCELVIKHLNKELYSKAEVCDLLKVSEEELNRVSLGPKTFQVSEFKLKQRALHVFSESQRVLQFKRICDGVEVLGASGFVELGTLMNDSHHSCKLDYECSCHELDELVEFARINGALGCRLTGAGWGGCCVVMVQTGQKEALLTQLEDYYDKKGLSKCQIKEALFDTQPGNGASIIKLQ